MNTQTRINLTDTTTDIVVKMADGNPGAANVLIQIMRSDNIDPDSTFGVLGAIITLDELGIYGTDIYVLNSDICGRNISKMIAVLRAVQLGLFDRNTLKDACGRQDRSGRQLIPVEELYLKVRTELPNFDAHSNN